jgi:predicted Zn finger-like uncharacterized protein
MILACSLCHARYLISASHFVDGPRMVRCARCSHTWHAGAADDISDHLPPSNSTTTPQPAAQIETNQQDQSPPPELTEPPEAVSPIPPGSNLPALPPPLWIIWLRKGAVTGAGILIFLILFWGIFFRQTIVKDWPQLESFYNSIGLHISHPGDGLLIEGVHPEIKYEDGSMKLVVEGVIRNAVESTIDVPDVLASVVGPDGGVLQSWRIDAPAATLGKGLSLPFHSSITAPRGAVVQVNLSFVEAKNAE